MRNKPIAVAAIIALGVSSLAVLAARNAQPPRHAAPTAAPRQSEEPAPLPDSVKTVSRIHSIQVVETKFEKNAADGQFDVGITLKNRSDKTVVAVTFKTVVKKGESRGWVKTNVKPDGTETPLIAPGETHTFRLYYDGGSGVIEVTSALFDDGSDDSVNSEAGDQSRKVRADLLERAHAKEGQNH